MTLPTEPIEWRCNNCGGINQSGPAVKRRPDGGEDWKLICGSCLAVTPVARISARGVTLRRRINSTTDERKKRQLIDRLQAEIQRL